MTPASNDTGYDDTGLGDTGLGDPGEDPVLGDLGVRLLPGQSWGQDVCGLDNVACFRDAWFDVVYP